MRVLSSILIIIGILVTLGGVAGLVVGNPTGGVRLGVGIVLIIIAAAIRPGKPVDREAAKRASTVKTGQPATGGDEGAGRKAEG